jgi:hypothetical protein
MLSLIKTAQPLPSLLIIILMAIATGCKGGYSSDSASASIDTALNVLKDESPLNIRRWSIDSVFQQWNVSTIRFLNVALKSSSPKKTELYEFSKDAILHVNSSEKLANESIRKTFLTALQKDSILLGEEYFLIETFRDGETSTAITYLAMVQGNTLSIHKYSREESEVQWKWVADSITTQHNQISQLLSTYELQTNTGINNDLVIITRFRYNIAYETFLFQSQSLSPNIGLRKIIE